MAVTLTVTRRVTDINGLALHPMSPQNLSDVLRARLNNSKQAEAPAQPARFKIVNMAPACGCNACCFACGEECNLPRSVESCLIAAQREGIDPMHAGYLDTEAAPTTTAGMKMPPERPCCGTFRGSPHRTTCLNYREGGE